MSLQIELVYGVLEWLKLFLKAEVDASYLLVTV